MAFNEMGQELIPFDFIKFVSPGDRTLRVDNCNRVLSPEMIVEYFQTFGKIEVTYENGICGCLFLTFTHESPKQEALFYPYHKINEKWINVRKVHLWNNRLFVRGFRWMQLYCLRMHFEKYGTVERIDSPNSKHAHWAYGFCFVQFSTERSACLALMSSHSVLGKRLHVVRARPRINRYAHLDKHNFFFMNVGQHYGMYNGCFYPVRIMNVDGATQFGTVPYYNGNPYTNNGYFNTGGAYSADSSNGYNNVGTAANFNQYGDSNQSSASGMDEQDSNVIKLIMSSLTQLDSNALYNYFSTCGTIEEIRNIGCIEGKVVYQIKFYELQPAVEALNRPMHIVQGFIVYVSGTCLPGF